MDEEKIHMKNSTVFFNSRLSVAKKLIIIKYAEERSIHTATNNYEISKSTIR